MPAAIALSEPYLSWADKTRPTDEEPLVTCEYAILPTGSMLEARQIMYGQIGSTAVPSSIVPEKMVVVEFSRIHVYPADDDDVERMKAFATMLCEAFAEKMMKLQLLEPAAVDQSVGPD
jgi:hypothetical protein